VDRARPRVGDDRSGLTLARKSRTRLVEVARETRAPEAERKGGNSRNGGGRAERRGDASATRFERHDVLRRLGTDVREDPIAQRGARRRAGGGDGQRLGRLPERRELLPALLATGEVGLVGAPLVGVERVERVACGQLWH